MELNERKPKPKTKPAKVATLATVLPLVAFIAVVLFCGKNLGFDSSLGRRGRKAILIYSQAEFEFNDELSLGTANTEGSHLPSPNHTKSESKMDEEPLILSDKKFYILPLPEVTDWLLENYTDEAYEYYQTALNEDQAEIWLHRSLLHHPSRTLDPTEADTFVICGYMHLYFHIHKARNYNRQGKKNRKHVGLDYSKNSSEYLPDIQTLAAHVANRVIDIHRPHLLAIPATNPTVSRWIGIKAIVKALRRIGLQEDKLWSLGFERNEYWQGGMSPSRIIPVPYVVTPPDRVMRDPTLFNTGDTSHRVTDFVFYIGDRRVHAQEWSGCDRSMLAPLELEDNMDVRLVMNSKNESAQFTKRLSQQEYNQRMQSSEYCLVVCGDSPTSRSLTTAVIHGCIPIRIGSRLRGLCEPPCHAGWGWTIAGSDNPHLVFPGQIDWGSFPEIDEAAFIQDPPLVLRNTLKSITKQQKEELRSIMKQHRDGFIYGWGSPVNSTDFGQAVNYIWDAYLLATRIRTMRKK